MIETELIKILVIDDHEVMRKGVKQILEENFLYVEVGEIETGQRAIAAVQREPWDLGIVDIGLPGQSGLELLSKLHHAAPRLPLAVMGSHTEKQYAVRAFRAGAMAYLTKETLKEELVTAIKQALAGCMYVTPSLGVSTAGSLRMNPGHPGQPALSDRELEVLGLLAQGRSVKHIAQSLTLSIKTVSTYRTRLLDKLQLTTTAELIRYAIDHHLVD